MRMEGIGLPLVESNITGSKETAWHDFTITQSGMDLIFSTGSFYLGGVERYLADLEQTYTVPSPTVDTMYRVYITEGGVSIMESPSLDQFDYSSLVNPLTLLAEFLVLANVTTLDNVEVTLLKVVET
jgi:hypothetical protein